VVEVLALGQVLTSVKVKSGEVEAVVEVLAWEFRWGYWILLPPDELVHQNPSTTAPKSGKVGEVEEMEARPVEVTDEELASNFQPSSV